MNYDIMYTKITNHKNVNQCGSEGSGLGYGSSNISIKNSNQHFQLNTKNVKSSSD